MSIEIDEERDKKRSEEVATVSSTLQAIFSHENVLELAILLLSHFLIIRTSDLEAWEETPEEWILEATGDVVTDQSGLRVFSLRSIRSNVRLREKVFSWNWFQTSRKI